MAARSEPAPPLVRLGARARAGVGLVVALCWLDLVLTLGYPGPEARLWYLIPAFDLLPLLGLYAALGHGARRLPAAGHALLVALLIAIRCWRFADGVKLRYFHRSFNAYLDLPLLPELLRLLQVLRRGGSITSTCWRRT